MNTGSVDPFSGASYCHVCQHHHEQGIKCHICGHSGRANIYKKMRDRSNLCRAYEIEHMNQYSCPDDLSGLKVIGAELRRRLFVEEMGVSVDVEFNESLGHFNYSFGKVGNAPVTIVKWKVMDDHGSKVLIIDNCGVLPSYRRRGLAKRTVFEILQLCASVTEIHSVVLYLPSTPWIIARCADQSLPCRMDKCSEVQCPWKAVVSVWRPQDMAAWMSR